MKHKSIRLSPYKYEDSGINMVIYYPINENVLIINDSKGKSVTTNLNHINHHSRTLSKGDVVTIVDGINKQKLKRLLEGK